MTNKLGRFKKIILIISFIIMFFVFLTLLCFAYLYNKYTLDIEKLTSINNGIKVYSCNGESSTLYNTNRSIIEIETLPSYVKEAFINVEDKRFYDHHGFDLIRIVKAGIVNVANKSKSQGASTISQQLIKNTLLTNEKTYSRKIQEVILSIKMEKIFEKDEILEMYLNTIYFGSNAYGIENASLTYFNKSAKDLTLNEACCLAGIIKSPNYYSPKKNYQACITRKNLIAKLLLNANCISLKEYNNVLNEPIVINSDENCTNSYEEEAIYEACKILNMTERELINKKYEIITFKDADLQNKIFEINKESISLNGNNESNLDTLSVVANNIGQIKAYVANSNYSLHNLTRQAASTLKPFSVYLPCLENDIISPASKILDEEINYGGFSPKNADGKYHGYVSCRYAISHSLNVPAVKLLDMVGLQKAKECLINAGFNITNADKNLSLALGATEKGVKVLNLLEAYVTLSNLGVKKPLCFVSKIIDSEGNLIYNHEEYEEKVFNEDSCFLLNDMLKDTAVNGTAKRLEDLKMPLASKTGTAGSSKGNTDLYNITYSTEHAILTWVADIKNTFLPANLLSSSMPTDINKKICNTLYSEHIPKDFSMPKSVAIMPYSSEEYINNNIIVNPQLNTAERYINYDYFKTTNPPKDNVVTENLNFTVELNKNGVTLSFDAKSDKIYNICKIIDNKEILIESVSNKYGLVEILDNNIFKHASIVYYITNENGKKLTENICIKPKDYLINLLNNELISTKKKWYV